MGNGEKNHFERLYKLDKGIGKLVLESKRNPSVVADVLQEILEHDDEWLRDWLFRRPVRWNPPKDPDPRFVLKAEFNIQVPGDYNHDTHMTNFRMRCAREFSEYAEVMVDRYQKMASTRLEPGEKLRVRVFHIVRHVGPEDIWAFLCDPNVILAGARGATLVYEQARDKLFRGWHYLSYDLKSNLRERNGTHYVPELVKDERGRFDFGEDVVADTNYSDNDALLCFYRA